LTLPCGIKASKFLISVTNTNRSLSMHDNLPDRLSKYDISDISILFI
jgi:hypothetical protein